MDSTNSLGFLLFFYSMLGKGKGDYNKIKQKKKKKGGQPNQHIIDTTKKQCDNQRTNELSIMDTKERPSLSRESKRPQGLLPTQWVISWQYDNRCLKYVAF